MEILGILQDFGRINDNKEDKKGRLGIILNDTELFILI